MSVVVPTVSSAVTSAVGGVLIGLAASAWLLLEGRIAGVSHAVGAVALPDRRERGALPSNLLFLAGLVVGGLLLAAVSPATLQTTFAPSTATTLAAGLLVGVGTQLGNGCTSGHGVCGLGRRSPRSLAAVITFMATAALTVAVTR
jgi:uncharacterized membrane protein YedE/YeeE